jgi:ribosomal protein S18 acetylase RimI-like enzyme
MIEKKTNLPSGHIAQFALILARAFQNDSLFQYALPDEQKRLSRLHELFKLNLSYGVKFGEVFTILNQGLAIWLPPGNNRITVPRAIWAGMWRTPFKVGLNAVIRLGEMNTISESLHKQVMSGLHWYLFMLAVDPVTQGNGLGGQLMQPVLAMADAQGLPCYLETSNPHAVRFYQKHGFSIAIEHQTPIAGLCIWAMCREGKQDENDQSLESIYL